MIILKTMPKPKLIFKQHKTLDYYCLKCNQFVEGNGSSVLPYRCDCGEWHRAKEGKLKLCLKK